jgi:DNA polymerase-3 subunit epsilon
MIRQIFLDTETTGLDPKTGHKIIEIGCIEVINRRFTGNNFHHYINPKREIDFGALKVHGITQEFLANKPIFADIAKDFLSYVHGAELIAHNAKFDLSFINYELSILEKYLGGLAVMENNHKIIDSLAVAKQLHPGGRNSLDALCKRYEVDNTGRNLHGALLDAHLLAQVYLAMTGGQGAMEFTEFLDKDKLDNAGLPLAHTTKKFDKYNLKVIRANEAELELHEKFNI